MNRSPPMHDACVKLTDTYFRQAKTPARPVNNALRYSRSSRSVGRMLFNGF